MYQYGNDVASQFMHGAIVAKFFWLSNKKRIQEEKQIKNNRILWVFFVNFYFYDFSFS
jgi:hypothetical protein